MEALYLKHLINSLNKGYTLYVQPDALCEISTHNCKIGKEYQEAVILASEILTEDEKKN